MRFPNKENKGHGESIGDSLNARVRNGVEITCRISKTLGWMEKKRKIKRITY